MLKNKLSIFFFILFISKDTYAYLDPASGNAIVCLVISLFGAFIFYLKNVFYKIVGIVLGKPIEKKHKDHLVIFSEGKSYFLTFKPIIEELINRKIHFSYLTMDVEDPALFIDNEYMNSRYIGKGNRAYSKISNYRSDVMLSTTPNIGCKEFPIKRSRKINHMVHIWHSVCDTSFYNLGALDYYDAALTVGPWVEKSIREIEVIRNIPHKDVVACGLPYLDEMKNIIDSNPSYETSDNQKKTILVAPSWGDKNCLKYYGTEFIKELAQKDFNIIIRPHPQSLKVENDFISAMQDEFSSYENVVFDFDSDGLKSMAKSSVLISDKSSMRFDYAILFEKPVVTLDIPQTFLKIYESSLLKEHFEDVFADQFGIRLDIPRKNEIVSSVEKALKLNKDYIKNINQGLVSNFRSSSKAIVDYLESHLKA